MWLFERVFTANVGGTINDILFDGTCIAVSAGKKVKFYSYWTQEANYEYLYDDVFLVPQQYVNLVEFFTWDLTSVAQNNLHYLAREGNNLFVSDGSLYQTIYRLDLSTRLYGQTKTTVDSTYTLPVQTNSKFAAANDRLWFVNYVSVVDQNTPRQRLYNYNILTSTSNSVDIPTRQQVNPVYVVHGNSEYVWITNNNNTSVMKFDVLTGNYVSTVRCAKDIQAIYANQNYEVFVGSVNGLVQSVNQSTDAVINLLASSKDGNQTKGVVDDGTFVWAVNDDLSLGRIHKTTKDAKFTNGESGYKIGSPSITYPFAGTARKIAITDPITYQYWDGSNFQTRNVRRYVFTATNTTLYGWRCQVLYRENSYQVRTGAMIAINNEKYYGESQIVSSVPKQVLQTDYSSPDSFIATPPAPVLD